MDMNYYNELAYSLRSKFPYAKEIEIIITADENTRMLFQRELDKYIKEKGFVEEKNFTSESAHFVSVVLPTGIKITVADGK